MNSATSIMDIKKAEALGGKVAGDTLVVPFYGTDYQVTSSGVTDMLTRPANTAVAAVLLAYVQRFPEIIPEDGPWITYREFSGAGPLMGYFTANTNKLIENTFAESIDPLENACMRLGGKATGDPGYDIAFEFSALPRVSVLLHFNRKDVDFPAQCSLLFRKSAETFLDMRSMAVCGTWLAGNLISHQ